MHKPIWPLLISALVLTGCGSSDPTSAKATTTTSKSAPTTSTIPGARPSTGCRTTASKAIADERHAVISDTGARPGVPAPVIVLLHGMGQDAQTINRFSDFPAKAAKVGTIVITPNATGSPAMWQPSATGADATYLTGLLDRIEASHCVDTARVYLVGFSVGAVMAATYACANQGRIAAIGTVAVQFPSKCAKPLAIIGFHGSADPIVAYDPGGTGAIGGGAGTEADMAAWADMAGCGPEPTRTDVASKAERLTWPGCRDDTQVVLYRIDGGGHAWPGSATDPSTVVPKDQSVDATATMLDFFADQYLRT